MKIIFLCGNETNHNYFVSRILDNLKTEKYAVIRHYSGLSNLEYYTDIYKKKMMNEYEKKYLHDFILKRNEGLEPFECLKFENEIITNTAEDFNDKIERLVNRDRYDYCFSYGAPIITNAAILEEDQKSLNLHFGLSRYYRGSQNNVYALARNEFYKVGLTAHKISKKVDKGKVLFEISPDKNAYASIHDINELNIYLLKKGVDRLIEILKSNRFAYKDVEYDNAELILSMTVTIEQVIKAEDNLKNYGKKVFAGVGR